MELSRYDKCLLSKKEGRLIKGLKKRYEKSNDSLIHSIVHLLAELIRLKHGYSGGVDGSEFISKKVGGLYHE